MGYAITDVCYCRRIDRLAIVYARLLFFMLGRNSKVLTSSETLHKKGPRPRFSLDSTRI